MPPSRLALRLATLVAEFTLNGGCPLLTCRLSAVPGPELSTLSMGPGVFPVSVEVALTLLVLPRRKAVPTPRPFAAAVTASTTAAPAAPAMSPLPKLSCICIPILARHGALSHAMRSGQDETQSKQMAMARPTLPGSRARARPQPGSLVGRQVAGRRYRHGLSAI